jgi:large subunit ribosomal protein L10
MARLRKEREALVETLTRDFEGVEGIVVAGYVGVKTAELNDLRGKLRPLEGRCRIVKNRLAKIAFKNRGIDPTLANFCEGQSALIFQKKDTLAGLKVLVDFEKTHANLKIRGGYLFGKIVNTANLKTMAFLPPRAVLLSQLLARLQSPVAGLAGVLTGDLRKLASLLEQVAKKKEA